MKYLFSQNAKMKNSSHKIYNFGIPAFRSKRGFATCPKAGLCVKGCYAKQGAYVWSNVSQAYENRLTATQQENFVEVINAEIKKRKIQFVRIHDSGDFYNYAYFEKWLKIAKENPAVLFYAYTKMIAMAKVYMASSAGIPSNLTLIFSEGGKQDALIFENDRHSRVFDSLDALKAAGYADVTHDDAQAFGENKRIGLVYHGAKSKAWSTEKGAACAA